MYNTDTSLFDLRQAKYEPWPLFFSLNEFFYLESNMMDVDGDFSMIFVLTT